jgi:hypothetical protein
MVWAYPKNARETKEFLDGQRKREDVPGRAGGGTYRIEENGGWSSGSDIRWED